MPSSSLGSTSPLPIAEIAAQLGLSPSSVEPYGWFAGKFVAGLEQQLADRPNGKLVGVTAITPTPFGEGKTVAAIGLAMGIARRERRAIVTLREPSLGRSSESREAEPGVENRASFPRRRLIYILRATCMPWRPPTICLPRWRTTMHSEGFRRAWTLSESLGVEPSMLATRDWQPFKRG